LLNPRITANCDGVPLWYGVVSPHPDRQMRLFRPMLIASASAAVLPLLAGACKKDPTGPKTVTTTEFKCVQPSGGAIGCEITIPSGATKLRVTMTSHDCDAHGNTISIVSPAQQTLTTDACYETLPKTVEIAAPFSVAKFSMKVTSTLILNPPELHVSGASPTWTIGFEDGGDQDFNDAILTVEAL